MYLVASVNWLAYQRPLPTVCKREIGRFMLVIYLTPDSALSDLWWLEINNRVVGIPFI